MTNKCSKCGGEKPQRIKCAKCGGEKSQVCSDRKNGSEYPYYVECNSCKTVSIFGETELEAINHWNEMNSFNELVADANSRDCLKYKVSSDSVIKNQTPPPKAEIMGMRISNCATCCIPSTNNINIVVDYMSYGKAMHSLQCMQCGRHSSWQDTLPQAIAAWNTEVMCNWNGTSQAESPKPSPTPEPTPTPGPASTPEPTSLPEISAAVTSSDSGDKNTTITVSMDRDTCKMVREIRIEFNGP